MVSTLIQEPETQEGLLTAPEAARHLGVSLRLVRKLTADGELGYYRVGKLVRFSREHLSAYLEAHERGAR